MWFIIGLIIGLAAGGYGGWWLALNKDKFS